MWLASAFVLAASGCTDYPPTETTNPLTVPDSRKDIVSVCYNEANHKRSEVEAVALAACAKGTASVWAWRVDEMFNDCPLFKKTRASFVCVPGR